MMSLEGEENGVKDCEGKSEKRRKGSVSVAGSSEAGAVRRRILRSDIAKLREKAAEEAKNGVTSVVVFDLDGIDGTVKIEEVKVENRRVLRSNSAKTRVEKAVVGERRRNGVEMRNHQENREKESRREKKFLEQQSNGVEIRACEDKGEQESTREEEFLKQLSNGGGMRNHEEDGEQEDKVEEEFPEKQSNGVEERIHEEDGESEGMRERREAVDIDLNKLAEEEVDGEFPGDGLEAVTCEKGTDAEKDSNTSSDVAKERGKDGNEEDGNSEVVKEGKTLGIDLNESGDVISDDNCAEQMRHGEEKAVECDTFDGRNGLEEEKLDEALNAEGKVNMELDTSQQGKSDDTVVQGNSDDTVKKSDKEVFLAESAPGTVGKINSAVRNRKNKVMVRVENRRVTRSTAAKLTEAADTSTGETELGDTDEERPAEKVTSEVVQNESNNDINNQLVFKIKEEIVESDTCNMTGVKVRKGTKKSNVAKQKEEDGSSKTMKKSTKLGMKRKRGRPPSKELGLERKSGTPPATELGLKRKRGRPLTTELGLERKRGTPPAAEFGLKRKRGRPPTTELGLKRRRGRPPLAADTSRMNNQRILKSFKQDQSDELEKPLRALRSKNDLPIVRKKDGPSGKEIKLIKECGLEGANVGQHKHLGSSKKLRQTNGSPISIRKEDSQYSHFVKANEQGKKGCANFPSTNKKTLGFAKSHFIGKSSPLKREASYGNGNGRTSELTDKEELRMARKMLRDQIKGMLLSAGWSIDLRPRKGTKVLDAVYVEPDGHTHWSIVKAYYAFEKCFSCEYDDTDKALSGKRHNKSRKSSSPSCTSISEEALSILKHPISRRRSRKEIEEAEMNDGDGNMGRNNKEHKKYSKDKLSRNKGAVNTASKASHLKKYRKKQKGNALLVRSFDQGAETGIDVYVPYAWKRTTLSWMIDMGILLENTAVKYMNPRRTKKMLTGQIKRDGIDCDCCRKIFSVSEFEIHAGSKQCKPYQNILLEEDGTSLLQCQIHAWEKQDESERRNFYSVDIHGDDPNDDACGICGDGGELICCDGCPSTFHQSCLGTVVLPPSDWYCMNCSCRYCALNSDVVAQGDSGIDSPLLSCAQCKGKYHETCVPEYDASKASSSQSCSSYCGQSCKKVFEELHKLLGVKNYLEEGFSWTVIQRLDEALPESVHTLDQRAECNSKIAIALSVMDECFVPIIDQRSGFNLIHNVVYNCGSNFSRLNYSGFYTFILEQNDEIISVASLRIHGTRVAEMPFIGTRNMFRHQGMCRRLLDTIELVLRSLNIKKLIIPSISELRKTWTTKFGFKLLEVSEKEEMRSINLLVFPGIGLLVKQLMYKEDSAKHHETSEKVDQFEPESPCRMLPSPVVEPHTSVDGIARHKPDEAFSGGCIKSPSDVSTKASDASAELQDPESRPS